MSEQNSYRIEWNYKRKQEWRGCIKDVLVETADTWQDAIQKWSDQFFGAEEYTVVAETPSADGRSGIMEIEDHWPGIGLAVRKIKATLIDD